MLTQKLRTQISLFLLVVVFGVSAMFWTMGNAGVESALADGVYTGKAKGFMDDIEVAVTIAKGKIEKIEVISINDTPAFADMAVKQVIPAIIAAQGTDGVDVASGASYSSKGIIAAVEQALSATTGYKDGEYEGTAQGFGGQLKVKVIVTNGKIANISVLSHSETPGISDGAIAQIPGKIVASGQPEVEIVSGATMTSKAIMAAVSNALANAQ